MTSGNAGAGSDSALKPTILRINVESRKNIKLNARLILNDLSLSNFFHFPTIFFLKFLIINSNSIPFINLSVFLSQVSGNKEKGGG